MAWHSPFDLYYWFVNVLAGDLTIFLAISFLVLGMVAGMFRMPTILVAIMFALFIIMLSVFSGTWLLLVILAMALAIGWGVSRFFK